MSYKLLAIIYDKNNLLAKHHLDGNIMDADLAVLLTRQLNLDSRRYYKAYNYKNKILTKNV
jgi:hypothetical protein